jgi:ABC-type transport system substrate-binding protein
MAEAGYASGLNDVVLGCPAPEERKGAEVVASQLSKIGITAKVNEPEIGQLLDMFFVKKNFTECVCGGDGVMDPDLNFYTVYRPLPTDVSGYNNPDVIAMWQQQEAEQDPNKRAQIWTKLLNQALGQDVYAVWLNFRPMFFVHRSYVKGFQYSLDRRNKFWGVYLQK